jgi:DNA-binding response OmpR family regulator
MKILIIEDEQDLQDAIKTSLGKEDYMVETAGDFATAYEKLFIYEYDCILLDITLPGGNGLDLLKALKRKNKSANIIIISAKNSLDNKLEGLQLGADDYLTKPFHLAELNARIKAVLRRNKLDGKNTLELGNVCLDLNDRLFYINHEEVALNRKEFDIIQYFLLNKNRLVTRAALAEYVWGDHIDQADNFDFIYSQIKNIRKKLKDTGAQLEIQAVYGVGYKLIEL